MGFILFYLQIRRLCDITDAYSFEKRAIASGPRSRMLFRPVLASLGMILWWATEPGAFLNNVALVTILVAAAGAGHQLEPPAQLDGYYILMDLLEAPNLMDNSKRYLGI